MAPLSTGLARINSKIIYQRIKGWNYFCRLKHDYKDKTNFIRMYFIMMLKINK